MILLKKYLDNYNYYYYHWINLFIRLILFFLQEVFFYYILHNLISTIVNIHRIIIYKS